MIPRSRRQGVVARTVQNIDEGLRREAAVVEEFVCMYRSHFFVRCLTVPGSEPCDESAARRSKRSPKVAYALHAKLGTATLLLYNADHA